MIIDNKCRVARKVKDCGECCRFHACRYGEPTNVECNEATIKLGMAIVGDVVLEYENAFKKGHKNHLRYYTNWFKPQQTNILTAEQYDGQAILENLALRCEKKYGKFDDIYTKCQKKLDEKISQLTIELKKAKTNNERKLLKRKITKLNGEKSL